MSLAQFIELHRNHSFRFVSITGDRVLYRCDATGAFLTGYISGNCYIQAVESSLSRLIRELDDVNYGPKTAV